MTKRTADSPEPKASRIFAASRCLTICLAAVLCTVAFTAQPGTIPRQSSAPITVYSFGGPHSPPNDGVVPKGSLTFAGGLLYGRTTATESTVNTNNPTGVVFQFDPSQPSGSNYATIHTFAGTTTDGADPRHDAMTIYGSLLLGATQNGGSVTNNSCGGKIGCGAIYAIDVSDPLAPIYDLIHSFSGTPDKSSGRFDESPVIDGAQQHSSFVYDNNGILYAQTAKGGTDNDGVIYELTPGTGTFDFNEQVLYSFHHGTGDQPHGRLTISDDGTVLYGMTRKGGKHSDGVIFEYVIGTGQYCVLHDFGGCDKGDGVQSDHGYLTAIGSTLYGMTTYGGTHGCKSPSKGNPAGDGVLFALQPPAAPQGDSCPSPSSVTYAILHEFGDTKHDGRNPYGSLLASDSGGDLYGTSANGGDCKEGTVFDLTLDPANPLKVSNYSRLHSFCYDAKSKNYDGASPIDNVTLVNGTLYGMTDKGGEGALVKNGAGTIFALPLNQEALPSGIFALR